MNTVERVAMTCFYALLVSMLVSILTANVWPMVAVSLASYVAISCAKALGGES